MIFSLKSRYIRVYLPAKIIIDISSCYIRHLKIICLKSAKYNGNFVFYGLLSHEKGVKQCLRSSVYICLNVNRRWHFRFSCGRPYGYDVLDKTRGNTSSANLQKSFSYYLP